MQVAIGKGLDMEVPAYTTLDQAVLEHILYTGWRNLLMDSHAGVTAEKVGADNVTEKSREAAQRKLQSLINGEVRTVATREGDPIKVEALRLAINGVKKKHREEGKKIDEKEIKAKAREFLATPGPALDKVLAKAKRNVKEANDIDIEV
jgi:hypothetical protein